jgi:hypothetical protein
VDRRLAFAIGLAIAALTVAGCIQDLERRQLDTGWQAGVSVDETPVAEVDGAPAMVVVEGAVDVPADVDITLTGFSGELSRENASIPLEAMRVNADEGTRKVADAEGELSIEAGEQLRVTFVPGDDADRRANPTQTWNASLEVQWRYKADGEFDAGRLEVERNVTPAPVGGLGVGVVQRVEGEVRELVFEAIEVEDVPASLSVEVLQLGGGSVEAIDTVDADVNRSDGTARLGFAEPISVPEGSGYLVFRLDGLAGTASADLREAEDPIPATGAAVGVALLAATAWVAGRHRRM